MNDGKKLKKSELNRNAAKMYLIQYLEPFRLSVPQKSLLSGRYFFIPKDRKFLHPYRYFRTVYGEENQFLELSKNKVRNRVGHVPSMESIFRCRALHLHLWKRCPGFLRSLKIRTLPVQKQNPTARDRIHERTIFIEVLRKNLDISQT
jgi:hypothetical protein